MTDISCQILVAKPKYSFSMYSEYAKELGPFKTEIQFIFISSCLITYNTNIASPGNKELYQHRDMFANCIARRYDGSIN